MANRNNAFKIVVGVLAVLGVLFILSMLMGVISLALHYAIPLAIIAGVVYVVYKVSSSTKSIGGSGRRPLP